MKKIAIFASGNGSNFEAIVKQSHELQFQVAVLICDRQKALVISKAQKLQIPTVYFSKKKEKDCYEKKIDEVLQKNAIDLVVLAGYMKIVGPYLLKRWEQKIINVHPSLLPKYPGANAIERAYQDSCTEYGITIHYVDEGIDTGKIIFQDKFTASKSADLKLITNRIHQLEHQHYAFMIKKILEGKYDK